MKNSFWETILNQLSQESTWLGITAILTAAGIALSPALSTQIAAVGLAVVGLIKVIIDERKKDK
jgi:membrane protein implicated in regulation of membrane protease activity